MWHLIFSKFAAGRRHGKVRGQQRLPSDSLKESTKTFFLKIETLLKTISVFTVLEYL